MENFYVRRSGVREDLLTGQPVARNGWTGPIEGRENADREAEAWRACGWTATVEPATAVCDEVTAWEDAAIAAMKDSPDPGQRRRWREWKDAQESV